MVAPLKFYVDKKDFNLKLNRFVEEFGDLKPAFVEVGRQLAQYNKSQFQGLKSLAPLNPKYKAWKDKEYPGQPILVLTGTLRDSLTKKNAKGAVHIATRTGLLYGSTIHYGKYVQEGTKHPTYNSDGSKNDRAGQQKMPPRVFFFLDEKREKIIFKVLDAYVAQELQRIFETGAFLGKATKL